MDRRQAQELATAYMAQHSDAVPLELLFESAEGWVFSCRREQIGGSFAVLVKRHTGQLQDFGVGAAWHNVIERIGSSAFLCAEPAAKSAALIDRIVQLSGATLEELAGAQALLGSANVLLLGGREQIEGLRTLLVREGFGVYARDSDSLRAQADGDRVTRAAPVGEGGNHAAWRRTKVRWRRTGDGETPYEADVGGQRWIVRVNDFPADEFVYTLVVDGKEVEHFNGWPETWDRPD